MRKCSGEHWCESTTFSMSKLAFFALRNQRLRSADELHLKTKQTENIVVQIVAVHFGDKPRRPSGDYAAIVE